MDNKYIRIQYVIGSGSKEIKLLQIKIDKNSFLSTNQYLISYQSLLEGIQSENFDVCEGYIEYYQNAQEQKHKFYQSDNHLCLTLKQDSNSYLIADVLLQLHFPHFNHFKNLTNQINDLKKEVSDLKSQLVQQNQEHNLDILFLIGMPKEFDSVSCEKEINKVLQVFSKANIHITYEVAKSKQRLKEMMSFNPRILHVICHGKKYIKRDQYGNILDGEEQKDQIYIRNESDKRYFLVLEDYKSEIDNLYGDDLFELFSNSNHFPELIILNACHSEEIFEDMKRFCWKNQSHVLMVNKLFEINNVVCIKFICKFYAALIPKEKESDLDSKLKQIKQEINCQWIESQSEYLCQFCSQKQCYTKIECNCLVGVKDLTYSNLMDYLKKKDIKDAELQISKKEYDYLQKIIDIHQMKNQKHTCFEGTEKSDNFRHRIKTILKEKYQLCFCKKFAKQFEDNRQKLKLGMYFVKELDLIAKHLDENDKILDYFYIITIFQKLFLQADLYLFKTTTKKKSQFQLQLASTKKGLPKTGGIDFIVTPYPKLQIKSLQTKITEELINENSIYKLESGLNQSYFYQNKAFALKFLQNKIMKENGYSGVIKIFNLNGLDDMEKFEQIYLINFKQNNSGDQQTIFYFYRWNTSQSQQKTIIEYLEKLNLHNIEIQLQLEQQVIPFQINEPKVKTLFESLLRQAIDPKIKENKERILQMITLLKPDKENNKSQKDRVKLNNQHLLFLIKDFSYTQSLPLFKYFYKIYQQNLLREDQLSKRKLQRKLIQVIVMNQDFKTDQNDPLNKEILKELQTIREIQIELNEYKDIMKTSDIFAAFNQSKKYEFSTISLMEVARAIIMNNKNHIQPKLTVLYLISIELDPSNYRKSTKIYNDILKIHKKILEQKQMYDFYPMLLNKKIEYSLMFDQDNFKNICKLLIQKYEFTDHLLPGINEIYKPNRHQGLNHQNFLIQCRTLESIINNADEEIISLLKDKLFSLQVRYNNSQKDQEELEKQKVCSHLYCLISLSKVFIKFYKKVQQFEIKNIEPKMKYFICKIRELFKSLERLRKDPNENLESLVMYLEFYYSFEVELEQSNIQFERRDHCYLNCEEILIAAQNYLDKKQDTLENKKLVNDITSKLSYIIYLFNSTEQTLFESMQRSYKIETIINQNSNRIIFKQNLLNLSNSRARFGKLKEIKKILILDESEFTEEFQNNEKLRGQINVNEYIKSLESVAQKGLIKQSSQNQQPSTFPQSSQKLKNSQTSQLSPQISKETSQQFQEYNLQLLIIINQFKIEINQTVLKEKRVIWFDGEVLEQLKNKLSINQIKELQEEFLYKIIQLLLMSKSEIQFQQKKHQPNNGNDNFFFQNGSVYFSGIIQHCLNQIQCNDINHSTLAIFKSSIQFKSYVQELYFTPFCYYNCEKEVRHEQQITKIDVDNFLAGKEIPQLQLILQAQESKQYQLQEIPKFQTKTELNQPQSSPVMITNIDEQSFNNNFDEKHFQVQMVQDFTSDNEEEEDSSENINIQRMQVGVNTNENDDEYIMNNYISFSVSQQQITNTFLEISYG